MRATFARVSFFNLLLLATAASAQSLKPPDNLVDLRSPQGESFLLETRALEAYFPISVAFETQKNQAYCGVASMVMALNALGVPAPSSPEFQPYAIFTQDNVLSDKTDTILPRDVLAHHGMTLDQLGQILSSTLSPWRCITPPPAASTSSAGRRAKRSPASIASSS